MIIGVNGVFHFDSSRRGRNPFGRLGTDSAVASDAAWRCSASPGANCAALRSDAARGRARGGLPHLLARSGGERLRGAPARRSSAYPLLIYLSICRVAHRDGKPRHTFPGALRCKAYRARGECRDSGTRLTRDAYPFTRSPFTVHRSPFTVHPFTRLCGRRQGLPHRDGQPWAQASSDPPVPARLSVSRRMRRVRVAMRGAWASVSR